MKAGRAACVRASGSVGGSDQRDAARVSGSGKRERPAVREPSFRVAHTNSLTLTPSLAANRAPACPEVANFPTSRSYGAHSIEQPAGSKRALAARSKRTSMARRESGAIARVSSLAYIPR